MGDSAIRAITDDGAFRVIAISSTETARGAAAAQGLGGGGANQPLERLFAELVTGTILIRHTMAPDLRVQVVLQGDDPASRMVADAHPDGWTRGLVQLAQHPQDQRGAKSMTVAKKGLLKVARTLHDGALRQGIVQVPDGGSLSGALMRYMQDSEQIVSVASVGCTFTPGGELEAAGGFILQLLPEVGEGPLAVLTERMRDFEKMEPLLATGKASPEALVSEILYGMPYAEVGRDPLRFGCNCSQARVAASLASLPRSEIQAMVDDKRVLEIGCDYCGREYQVAPEQLRGLLEAQ